MRSQLRAKHINDSMFSDDFVTCHYNKVILENSDIMLA